MEGTANIEDQRAGFPRAAAGDAPRETVAPRRLPRRPGAGGQPEAVRASVSSTGSGVLAQDASGPRLSGTRDTAVAA